MRENLKPNEYQSKTQAKVAASESVRRLIIIKMEEEEAPCDVSSFVISPTGGVSSTLSWQRIAIFTPIQLISLALCFVGFHPYVTHD